MSQYLYFHLRTEDDTFICLNAYSRSSSMYNVCGNYAPYEAISEISPAMLQEIDGEIRLRIAKYNKKIEELKERISQISNFTNNSVEEKLEAIENLNETIADIKLEIEELEQCKYFFLFYGDVFYVNEKNTKLYFGIECWKPTIQDIKS